MFKKITTSIALASVLLLVGATAAYAGSLTPPGAPANTMYTMTDIFNLSAGTTATLGSGTIPATPDSVTASFKTLTEIYDAIVAQIANLSNAKIASGISAFGFTGTLFGDTDASKVLSSATYPGTMPTNALSSANDTVAAGYYAATTLGAVDTDLAESNIKSGVTIFGKVGTALGAQLITTNQTICYNDSGAVITCAGTGQDGELQKGVARSFTDNSTTPGTITDNNTGLVWQKQDNATTYTWTAALAYCNANTAGLPGTGWRLPNVYELYSLVDFGVAQPGPYINLMYFPAMQSGGYWSSTTFPNNYSVALYVYFDGGYTDVSGKINDNYVRCVRG